VVDGVELTSNQFDYPSNYVQSIWVTAIWWFTSRWMILFLVIRSRRLTTWWKRLKYFRSNRVILGLKLPCFFTTSDVWIQGIVVLVLMVCVLIANWMCWLCCFFRGVLVFGFQFFTILFPLCCVHRNHDCVLLLILGVMLFPASVVACLVLLPLRFNNILLSKKCIIIN